MDYFCLPVLKYCPGGEREIIKNKCPGGEIGRRTTLRW